MTNERTLKDKDGIPHPFRHLSLSEAITLEERLGGPLLVSWPGATFADGLWLLARVLDKSEAETAPLFDWPSAVRATVAVLAAHGADQPKRVGSRDDQ